MRLAASPAALEKMQMHAERVILAVDITLRFNHRRRNDKTHWKTE